MQSIGPTIAYDGQFMFDAYYTAGKFPDRWKKTTMPVLVLNGDASFPFMPSAAAAVAAALPNASQKVLKGQDRGPKPDVMAPVLREFLGAEPPEERSSRPTLFRFGPVRWGIDSGRSQALLLGTSPEPLLCFPPP